MIAVVQRVREGRVEVGDEVVGAVPTGFVVLLGVGKNDREAEALYLAKRIDELRVFQDSNGKMNLSLKDVEGEVLAVPQFTLLAGLRKGRRPDFLAAAERDLAEALFHCFVDELRRRGVPVQTGRFGACMEVSLVNIGPATFIFNTQELLDQNEVPGE